MKITDIPQFAENISNLDELTSELNAVEFKLVKLQDKYEMEVKKFSSLRDKIIKRIEGGKTELNGYHILKPSDFFNPYSGAFFNIKPTKTTRLVYCNDDTLEIFTPIGLSLDKKRILGQDGSRHCIIRVYYENI